ncbi:MAG: alpha/beta hydrolase [Longispora sp.]|nr:alpha/beta hydrolase [Longispora sp. (in: high G+C Gram-positive bacteria)]
MPPTGPGAEPALYVHGLGGSGQNWTELASLLGDRLQGQTIDLPGFGLSEPVKRYGITPFASRVIRWIEYSDRGPVHLFGNSLGGAVSVRVAATRPDLVRSLTLISPAMPFIDPRWSVQSRLLPLLFLPRAAQMASRRMAGADPAELARMVYETCYADHSRITDQMIFEAAEEARRQKELSWYADAYVKTFRDLIRTFVRAYLPGSGSLWKLASLIQAPTLVISGRQDRLIDVRVAPRVASVIPDSRLLILDQVGHTAQMEVPRTVARATLGLLDELAERHPTPPPRPAPYDSLSE